MARARHAMPVGLYRPVVPACDVDAGFVRKFNGDCEPCGSGEGGELMFMGVAVALCMIGLLAYAARKARGALKRFLHKRTIKARVFLDFIKF